MAATSLVAALGSDRQGKLALWQVIARVLDQGSRLSAVPLAGGHAAGAAHGMIGFDEDDLFANLDWLAQHQAAVETRLFAQRKAASAPDVFLYDVTSRRRRDARLSIELFAGNTSDVKTFSSQLSKAAARFGAERVTFVGDRGMIKAPQRAELGAANFHYITAITKAQIDGLIRAGVLHMDLFEETFGGGRRQGRRALCGATQSVPRQGIGDLTAGQTSDASNGRVGGRQILERASESGGEDTGL